MEDAFAAAWNESTSTSLPQVTTLTPDRRGHIRVRLTERPLSEWREVMARIEGSSFCRGESNGGWVASFDWLIESPDPAVKALEGKYDDRNRNNGSGRGQGHVNDVEATQRYLADLRKGQG